MGNSKYTKNNKIAADRLRESEERYRTIVSSAMDGYWMSDTQGRILDVNDAYCRMSGYSAQELLKMNISDLEAKESKDDTLAHIKKIIAVGEDRFETRHRRKDGSVYNVEVSVQYRDDDGGKFIGFLRDITERKLADEALRESEERLQKLSDNLPDGMVYQIDSGLDGLWRKFTYLSAGVETLHQVKAADAMADPMLIYGQVIEKDIPKIAELEALALARMKPFGAEAQVRLPSGEIRWRHFRSAPHRLQNGRVIWDGIELDITDRKRAEEALVESERRFREMLGNVQLVAVMLDLDGNITFINDYLLNLTGRGREASIGKNWFDMFILPEEGVREMFVSGIKKEAIPTQFENHILCKNGNRRLIDWNNTMLRDASGKPVGVACIGQDITDIKLMEAEARKSQKLESIGLLAGGIAHDFRNILTALLGNIQLAKMGADPQCALFERLSKSEDACSRAAQLTQQLLTFAKGGEPVKKEMSVDSLLRHATQFSLRGSNAKCELSIPDDLWHANVDEGQIYQVISNLVINADQAMSAGGVLKVAAQNVFLEKGNNGALPLFTDGKYIKISVIDEGVGIPESDLAKIFDPYFTTKPLGHGLGLAICHSIVKKHGGFMSVESTTGKGASFDVYLPALSNKAEEAVKKADEIFSGNGKILFMDDDDSLRMLALDLFAELGYEIEVAENGQKAIELYGNCRNSSDPFDVVILDLTIPGGMGGMQCMEKLLEMDPNVKAIVSSGYANDPVLSNYAKFGFKAALNKPFFIDQVARTLKSAIGSR